LQFCDVVIDRRDRDVKLRRHLAQQLSGFLREDMRVGVDRSHCAHFLVLKKLTVGAGLLNWIAAASPRTQAASTHVAAWMQLCDITW
jgi:hypothetical protein